MSIPRIKGITIEQMNQLVEMTRHFYADSETHVYQDPDFPDNIVIASEKGDNYNTIGWYQACYELILPKIADEKEKGLITGFVTSDDVVYAFVKETFEKMNGMHPIDLLWSSFQVFKEEGKNDSYINKGREKSTS